MEVTLRKGATATRLKLVPDQAVKLGRHYQAHYVLTDTSASNAHVELAMKVGPSGDQLLVAKDTSLNGTGLVLSGGGVDDATPMTRGEWTEIPWGGGLLIPMRRVNIAMAPKDEREVLWVEREGRPRGDRPEPTLKTR